MWQAQPQNPRPQIRMEPKISSTMIEAALMVPLAKDGTPIMAVFPQSSIPKTCHEIR